MNLIAQNKLDGWKFFDLIRTFATFQPVLNRILFARMSCLISNRFRNRFLFGGVKLIMIFIISFMLVFYYVVYDDALMTLLIRFLSGLHLSSHHQQLHYSCSYHHLLQPSQGQFCFALDV